MKSIFTITLLVVCQVLGALPESTFHVLDENGKRIHEIHNAFSVSAFSEGYSIIQANDGIRIIDHDFNVVYESADHSIYQWAEVREGLYPYYDTDLRKYGYRSVSGEIVIPSQYDYADNFYNGRAIVGYGDTSGPPPHNLTLGAIRTDGSIAIPIEYDFLRFSAYKAGIAIAYSSPKAFFIVDTSDTVGTRYITLDSEYTPITQKVRHDILVVRNDTGKYGFVSWDGSLKLEPQYDAVWGISSEHEIVDGPNGSNYVVDRQGNIIIDSHSFTHFLNDRILSFIEDGKAGVISISGSVLIEPQYETILPFDDNRFIASSNHRFALLDLEGNKLTEFIYSYFMRSMNNGIVIAKLRD